jgi:NifU-like protein
LTQSEKNKILEEVIIQDIRPYVQLDQGDVEVKKIDGYQITIGYKGSCTTCFSATGSTLNAIAQIFKAKVNPNIEVIPDLSSLGK